MKLFRRRSRTRPEGSDVDAELAFHLEMQTRRYEAEGLDRAAARERAHTRLGDIDQARQSCRTISGEMEGVVRRAAWWHGLRQDVTYAARSLRKAPLFTATALLTVAIGIGANTAVFSVVNAVLLRSVGYADANRLVMIWNSYEQTGLSEAAIASAEVSDIRDRQHAFDAVAAIRPQASSLTGECGVATAACDPERVLAYVVSPEFFDVLRVRPAHGRPFNLADGAAEAPRVILLSDALWQRRFGGDLSVIGTTVSVSGLVRTIVGVMPPGVRFPDAPVGFLKQPADLWIPFDFARSRTDGRGNQNLAVIARVHADSSVDRAQADLDQIADSFRREFPDRYARPGLAWRIKAVPMLDMLIGNVRPTLLVLWGAVGLVLLIACANVANLVLARGTSRQRELAVRAALGASRGRIVRQLTVESGMLVSAGGALGIGLAFAGVRGLLALDPGDIPYLDRAALDLRVLLFAAGITVLTGLLIGLAPAARQSAVDPQLALGDGTRSSTGRVRRGFRRALVVAEVALAMVVLVGAGLLVRSFSVLTSVPTGIDAANTVAAEISLPRARYDSSTKIVAFHRGLVDRLTNLPGVTRASAVYPLPMSGNGWGGTVIVHGRPESEPEPHAEYAVAMPGYFRTLRIPMIDGRDFSNDDTGVSAVAIVDEMFARQYWPGQSAVGKRISPYGPPKDDSSWTTVIGVVRHVRNAGGRSEGEGQVYLPLPQNAQLTLTFLVDSTGPAAPLLPAIRAAVRDLDRELPVARLGLTADLLGRFVARERFNASLLAVFGAIALGLAGIGLYGLLSFLVAQRAREIGIRMALGGRPFRIVRLVVFEGLALAGGGIVIGGAAALALSRSMKDMLFAIGPADVATYSTVALLLLIVAALASFVPAQRATRAGLLVH